MPKCPMCDAEINQLICEQVCIVHYPLEIGCDGKYSYDAPRIMEIDDDRRTSFKCPECEFDLTDDEDEAMEFLKGKGLAFGELM